jgi:hypothetical protein
VLADRVADLQQDGGGGVDRGHGARLVGEHHAVRERIEQVFTGRGRGPRVVGHGSQGSTEKGAAARSE